MAKYKFRLETLQKLRWIHRDERRAALGEAYRAEQILAQQQTDLVEEMNELLLLQRAAASEEEIYLDINRLLEAQRYEAILRLRQQELTQQQKLLADEVERRRQVLVEADREVRTLELLDERHREQHRQKEQKLEEKRLDEVAITQWNETKFQNAF